ncbi:MAG: transposase [Chloroflexi bacterium]|nr:transposase [Chloroflexota bacterium]
MPEYRRAYLQGGTFFFTVVTYKRYPIFKEAATINLLRQCFQAAMGTHPFRVDAIVILPDHLHTIWTLPTGDSDFSSRWKRIKATFSRNYAGGTTEDVSTSMRRKREKGIWQRRFWEHVIRDQMDFMRHCDYIHYNPVRHGLVNSPLEWKYSSFRKFVARGLYRPDWGRSEVKELIDTSLE